MRSIEDITKEYAQQVQLAGEVQYRISVLKSDLDRMNVKLAELNKEALEIQKAQPKEDSNEQA